MSPESPMTSATVSVDLPAARIRLWPLVAVAGALTWAVDFLFWKQAFGLNVGLFAVLLAAGILAHRRPDQIGVGNWAALALLMGASVQSGLELCFTNGCVLVVLLLVLAGGTWYATLTPVWRRWLAQGCAVLMAPGRLGWVTETFLAQRPAGRVQNAGEAMSRMMMIVAPALGLMMVFMVLLAQGNLVFKEMLSNFGTTSLKWILQFDWSPWRLVFWLFAAAVVLAFLRPRETNAATSARTLGIWHRPDQRLAWLQCVVALTMLNALFALVNTVDVVEFANPTLAQAGMKEEVHDGVHHLIAATVLAGIVLAAIFQQQPALTRSRALRGLGHLWIAQNLIMAACVLRRAALYVKQSHLLTEKRIYVLLFLGLVVLGYLFLAVHVQRGGKLAWLVRRNALAAFALFYGIQFCDVSGLASQWCARQSLTVPGWSFDAQYWSSQGPAAWPAMVAVAKAPEDRADREMAREFLKEVRERESRAKPDWRAFQWREDKNRQAVLAGQ